MGPRLEVVIENDGLGYYVASVDELPGCHTQARTHDEVLARIREAVNLCLEVAGTPDNEFYLVEVTARGPGSQPSQEAAGFRFSPQDLRSS